MYPKCTNFSKLFIVCSFPYGVILSWTIARNNFPSIFISFDNCILCRYCDLLNDENNDKRFDQFCGKLLIILNREYQVMRRIWKGFFYSKSDWTVTNWCNFLYTSSNAKIIIKSRQIGIRPTKCYILLWSRFPVIFLSAN